jgi:polar amino acid transport system substrate-binding protein
LTTVALGMAVLAGAARGGAEEALPKLLRVGIDTRIPPWSYVPGIDYRKEDPTRDPVLSEAQLQKVEGIEIDMARAIGRRLDLPVKFVAVSWFDLEKGLVEKHFDLVLNAWTPNRQTPAGIVASEPYYTWGLLVAVPAADRAVRSYQDLAGRVVGAFKSVIADRTLQSVNARELRTYELQEDMFDDLQAGKLEAVVYDSPYVRWRAARESWVRAVGEPLNRLGYHVAVRKDAAVLYGKVQAAVKDIGASGEGERIKARWEGPSR